MVIYCVYHITQVAAGHHDAVRELEYAIVVLEALLVLDLGDDLDVCAGFAQDAADQGDVSGLAHKARSNEVDAVPHAEVYEVVDVFVCKSGQIHHGAWQIHVLLVAYGSTVHDSRQHRALLALRYLQLQRTIRYKYLAAHADRRRQGLVGARQVSGSAETRIVCADLNALSFY